MTTCPKKKRKRQGQVLKKVDLHHKTLVHGCMPDKKKKSKSSASYSGVDGDKGD